ncbi:MAG: hypothetical protein H6811_05410 [Phycisphaeraceae bacterium]|nr:hypothetical protein [Phycisphaeraceae bacterium]
MTHAQPGKEDLAEIARARYCLANFSVDVGTFSNPPGRAWCCAARVTGVLGVRGSATIDGALLLTFQPVYGGRRWWARSASRSATRGVQYDNWATLAPTRGDLESLDQRTCRSLTA